MAPTHFVQLARHDEIGLVTVCRHEVIHLTWHNVTVRMHAEALRRLSRLLDRGRALHDGIPIHDDELSVTIEEAEYRVTIGILELVVSPADFIAVTEMVLAAVGRLDRLVDSGGWDEPQSEPIIWTRPEAVYPPRFCPN